jgi:hypothetical protein
MPFTKSFGLVGENCVVTIAFGGYQDGSPSAFTANTYTCLAKSVRTSTSVDTADVSALCDTNKKMQVTKASGTVDIELLVDGTQQADGSPIFFNKEGFYCQVVITPGALSAKTFVGVVTATGIGIAAGEAVTETATIMLGANGVATAWTSA